MKKDGNGKVDVDLVSKRELVRECETLTRVSRTFSNIALAIAAELYRLDPETVVMQDGTLADEAVDQVVLRCEARYDTSRHYGWRQRLAIRWLKRLMPPKREEETGAGSETVS